MFIVYRLSEIEIATEKATSYESRQSVIEDVMSGALCERYTREDVKTSCHDLFGELTNRWFTGNQNQNQNNQNSIYYRMIVDTRHLC